MNRRIILLAGLLIAAPGVVAVAQQNPGPPIIRQWQYDPSGTAVYAGGLAVGVPAPQGCGAGCINAANGFEVNGTPLSPYVPGNVAITGGSISGVTLGGGLTFANSPANTGALTTTGAIGGASLWTTGSGGAISGAANTASGYYLNGTAVIGSTGTISPGAGGITGITNGSAAAAGSVGEVISSLVPVGSAVALTSGNYATITSVTLTPGDWECSGEVWNTNPAGVTITAMFGQISPTQSSVTAPALNAASQRWVGSVLNDTSGVVSNPTGARENVSVSTPVYLGVVDAFSGGAVSAYGKLACIRMR